MIKALIFRFYEQSIISMSNDVSSGRSNYREGKDESGQDSKTTSNTVQTKTCKCK